MTVTVHAAPRVPLDAALLERWRRIPVAVAIDVSREGSDPVRQIDPRIRPLNPPGRQPQLFGWAVVAVCEPPDFGAVLHAIDTVVAGDVLVIAAGGDGDTAMIGEILGGQLRRLGAVGIVCDGAVRDVATLAGWTELSVYARWITPRGPTSRERGVVGTTATVGGALVRPGDLVIGDDDGLAVVSLAAMAEHIDAAEAKLAAEADWERSLSGGASMATTFGLAAPSPGDTSLQP